MGKCKNCKRKCCKPLCIISWIVFAIGTTFLLILIFKPCGEMHPDFLMWLLPIVAISFVLASTLLYIILTKLECGSPCCCAWKFIWFLAHVGIFAYIIWINFELLFNSNEKSIRILRRSTTNTKIPSWFAYIQNNQNCCAIYGPNDYGKILGSNILISTCKIPMISSSGSNVSKPGVGVPKPPPTLNLTHPNGTLPFPPVFVPFNPHMLPMGCRKYLDEFYRDCPETKITFLIVMLIIGVIPFVIYSSVGQNKVKDEEQADMEEKGSGKMKGKKKDKVEADKAAALMMDLQKSSEGEGESKETDKETDGEKSQSKDKGNDNERNQDDKKDDGHGEGSEKPKPKSNKPNPVVPSSEGDPNDKKSPGPPEESDQDKKGSGAPKTEGGAPEVPKHEEELSPTPAKNGHEEKPETVNYEEDHTSATALPQEQALALSEDKTTQPPTPTDNKFHTAVNSENH